MTSRMTRWRVVRPSARSRSGSSVTLARPGAASGAVRLPLGAPRLTAGLAADFAAGFATVFVFGVVGVVGVLFGVDFVCDCRRIGSAPAVVRMLASGWLDVSRVTG